MPKTTITWPEEEKLNAMFMANYKKTPLSNYIRFCVEQVTGKDIKRLKDSIHEKYRIVAVDSGYEITKGGK